jgi:hypothetical protein
MLWSPEAHEPLVDEPWDAEAVRAAIREIAADAEAAFDDGWPAHPLDEPEPVRYRSLYLGGAGVVRALTELERRGLVDLARDYLPYLESAVPGDEHPPSLLLGGTGVRLVLERLAPSDENRERLRELIAANAQDERRELLWGSPGTMLAARELGEDGLWRESARWLAGEWDEESGVWTQVLYDNPRQFLGPAHGFAGCALALGESFGERAAATLRRYAVEEDGLANWPALAGHALDDNGDGLVRVQWCHGAPGMVTSLAGIAPDDPEHDRLLRAGGELTWRAGALTKGAGLCHGTAGNGYAFLALLRRTGDELWLDRARAFATHAAVQVARARAGHGRGRHTLWTGDLGTALYLGDCLAGEGSLPLP